MMTPAQLKKLDAALGAYLEEMVVGMGRLERRRAMEAYVTGLLLVAVPGQHKVWPPGATPHLPVKKAGAYGRPRTRFVDDSGAQPWTIEELALQLSED
ncbi:transposase [Corallococcus sp. Z5C101001]|uniref:transposase n=1 Tax=Corallococcus sp. Z5C101001 TaxID=2596829 RepID=UPI00117D9CB3|nr:transposase [Corallococcus sp. Z5C101001]TSC34066.1 transposase [Corallococcus sp. Z5C101001]